MAIFTSVLNWWRGFSANRPEVLIGAKGSLDGRKSPYLIVRNRSRFPVRIRAIEIEPKLIAIMGGLESRTSFRAGVDVSFSSTIAADSAREFPVVILTFGNESEDLPFSVRVDWRSSSRPDVQCRPITFHTSIKAISSMLNV